MGTGRVIRWSTALPLAGLYAGRIGPARWTGLAVWVAAGLLNSGPVVGDGHLGFG
jgi:hypothetical protein